MKKESYEDRLNAAIEAATAKYAGSGHLDLRRILAEEVLIREPGAFQGSLAGALISGSYRFETEALAAQCRKAFSESIESPELLVKQYRRENKVTRAVAEKMVLSDLLRLREQVVHLFLDRLRNNQERAEEIFRQKEKALLREAVTHAASLVSGRQVTIDAELFDAVVEFSRDDEAGIGH